MTERVEKYTNVQFIRGSINGHKRRKTAKLVRLFQTVHRAVMEAETPVGVPRFQTAHADRLTGRGMAAWVPNDREGPTVIINIDSPILEELVTYHQTEYADTYAEQLAKTVYRVIGEVAACKIAHSQKLTKAISEQELNRDYRSEKALTLSLMGLIAKALLLASDLIDCA